MDFVTKGVWFFLNLKSLLSFHNVLENNHLKSQFCSATPVKYLDLNETVWVNEKPLSNK